ncbi:hypothetical protein PBI_SCTP2_108 [Salicola phage SCTP-2]|nr:hypothetical protein PBI_SCTP2_108 [Salicola phage SCTP-2]
MLIKHVLNESAKDDIEILINIADIIISKLPSRISKNDSISISYESLSNSYKIPPGLPDKYKNYYDILLNETSYYFSNYETDLDSPAVGEFKESAVLDNNIINVFIPVLLGEAENISKDRLISFYNQNRSIKTFRSVLIHEMRHAIQNDEYKDYFNQSADENPYENDPVEIDAAWMHHLNDFDVNNYDNAQNYVNAVMKSFSNYKYLSKKQKEHYRRKTVRYYYEHREDNKEHVDIETRKMNKIYSYIENDKNEILKGFDALSKDLREYGHPESQRFLLPKDNFRKLLFRVLNNPESVKDNSNLYIIFSILPLIYQHYKFNIVNLEKYFKALFEIDSNKALKLIQTKGVGPLDEEFFIDKIKEIFK